VVPGVYPDEVRAMLDDGSGHLRLDDTDRVTLANQLIADEQPPANAFDHMLEMKVLSSRDRMFRANGEQGFLDAQARHSVYNFNPFPGSPYTSDGRVTVVSTESLRAPGSSGRGKFYSGHIGMVETSPGSGDWEYVGYCTWGARDGRSGKDYYRGKRLAQAIYAVNEKLAEKQSYRRRDSDRYESAAGGYVDLRVHDFLDRFCAGRGPSAA
jgi:hypothetical protein